MLVDHARIFLVLLVMTLLATCGGGGGSPGTVGTGPGAKTGTLVVDISGLRPGVSGAVRVTGPGNLVRDLTQSQTLPDLAPGSYSISASSVTAGATTYSPSPAAQSAMVAAGASASASVAYAAVTLTIGLREVASGLADPVFLTAPAGDLRQFIVERGGRIRILQNDTLVSLPFLDIGARVRVSGEGGLLSMAFDPQYTSNGYFYVYYTDPDQNIVVERYTVSANPNLADPTSALRIIRIAHPTFTNHFGGLVSFGPDGYLYLGTGDGGGAGDPPGNAQNLNVLLGKLLRLDVSRSSLAQPYAIPPSNPYLGQAGRRPEIWAPGLRNPWRYAFDGARLYIADVGQSGREEVDISAIAQGGLNYGWNTMEGTLCYNATSCDRTGLTLPAFEYDHGASNANGCSIIGGYVYRGAALPELAGHYFYSDYCAGFLKSFLATDAGVVAQRDWTIANPGPVVSFGRDAQGELYLIASSGKIYRIGRSTAPQG